MCGLTHADFLAQFERANLLDSYPGRLAKGDAFDRIAARFSACNMTPRLARRRTVLLGRNVAAAFHMADAPLFRWVDDIGDGALVAVAPHPSGISHWWNDHRNLRRARRFWRKLCRTTG